MSKRVKIKLDKITKTADLNKGELMDPRLIVGNQHMTVPGPLNMGVS